MLKNFLFDLLKIVNEDLWEEIYQGDDGNDTNFIYTENFDEINKILFDKILNKENFSYAEENFITKFEPAHIAAELLNYFQLK